MPLSDQCPKRAEGMPHQFKQIVDFGPDGWPRTRLSCEFCGLIK